MLDCGLDIGPRPQSDRQICQFCVVVIYEKIDFESSVWLSSSQRITCYRFNMILHNVFRTFVDFKKRYARLMETILSERTVKQQDWYTSLTAGRHMHLYYARPMYRCSMTHAQSHLAKETFIFFLFCSRLV